MTPIERPDELPAAADRTKSHEGLAIIATPLEGEQPQVTRTPDGGFTVFLKGEIQVVYRPPAPDAAKSPVTLSEAPTSGLLPDPPPPSVTEPHSAGEVPSWEKPRADFDDIPESENNKIVLEGNPAKKLGYRVTKRSNTRIADFVFATHPQQETTEYWRIRAFGDQAEKVRDRLEVGQQGVAVSVYGPKYWESRKKTSEGYIDTVVKGYNAGFVKISGRSTQETQSGNAEPKAKN